MDAWRGQLPRYVDASISRFDLCHHLHITEIVGNGSSVAKRQKSGPAVIVELIAFMPWWVGVALAAGLYFWLHGIAIQAVTVSPGKSMMPSVLKGFASVGQYILPALCLIGAAISAYRRSQRKNLVTNVSNSTAANALNHMTEVPFEFRLPAGRSYAAFD